MNIFKRLVHYILTIALGVILVGFLGYFSWYAILLEMFFVFLAIFWLQIFRPREKIAKKIFLHSIIFFFIVELFLFVVVPLSSIIPNPVLFSSGILQSNVDTNCDIDKRIADTKDIFRDVMDVSKLKFVYGGWMKNLEYIKEWSIVKRSGIREAMTFGNDVYLTPSFGCTNNATLVHETVHAWQYQVGFISGLSGVKTALRNEVSQFKGDQSIYEFGGEKGLEQSLNEGKRFRDFNIEAEAEIVETYYGAIKEHAVYDPFGFPLTTLYIEHLQQYVSEMGTVHI